LPFCTYELKEKLTAARRAQSQGKKTLNIDQDFILEEEEKAVTLIYFLLILAR
jgi:hypothetical protein